ncbi:glutaredoxin [Lutibacter sp. Hel_I_33_5]|uniref:glutaredoxin family protein n=1 Tax=Lutibacter sp. Hel_I_33_5 TaxID=1566289 RepID=UPI0011A65E2A|nr:glutaredoxin domain-containing protein [Lutibacter sp. Hel_I_33_5]TVZ56001.1 glutaredoxin [Lutibacter sp. Hel_I_33_5]
MDSSSLHTIKLYGAEYCHKTRYYKDLLNEFKVPFDFLDVDKNDSFAKELRNLYINKRLNFPTITIDKKKLRNPRKEELKKWIDRMTPELIKQKEE